MARDSWGLQHGQGGDMTKRAAILDSLGGGSDEIAALRDVEELFGVTLDYTHAGDWTTAGDGGGL